MRTALLVAVAACRLPYSSEDTSDLCFATDPESTTSVSEGEPLALHVMASGGTASGCLHGR